MSNYYNNDELCYNQFPECSNRRVECRHESRDTNRPYPNLDYARLVNNNPAPGQSGIGPREPLIFTDLLVNKGNIVRFTPNTANIILKDCGVYFVIYESQLLGTTTGTASLYLELDGTAVPGTGSTVSATSSQKVELVSHAIITAQKNKPNLLRLINSEGTVSATGANISIIKIAEF